MPNAGPLAPSGQWEGLDAWLHALDGQPLRSKIAILCAVFVLTRGVLMLSLWLLFRGNEPTSDVDYYLEIGTAPLAHLLGYTQIPYPPLQGFLLWPASVITAPPPAFSWAYRVFFTTVELGLYLAMLVMLGAQPRKFVRLLALSCTPLVLLSFPLWAQEEILPAVFIFAGLVAWHRERHRLATMLWALGIVAGKIYVLPLLALALVRALRERDFRAFVIAVAILGVAYAGRLAGGGTGFEGFVPDNDHYFTNGLWSLPVVLDNMALKTQYHLSAALCAVWAGGCLLYWFFEGSSDSIGVAYAAISAGIFVLFFHVNPEYYVLPFFSLLACYAMRQVIWKTLFMSAILFSCAWIHNLVYVVCESKKLLSCGSWVFPYGSLILTNVAAVLATVILVKEVVTAGQRGAVTCSGLSNKPYAGADERDA